MGTVIESDWMTLWTTDIQTRERDRNRKMGGERLGQKTWTTQWKAEGGGLNGEEKIKKMRREKGCQTEDRDEKRGESYLRT